MWLRRLPPEAFTGSIGPLPASEMFSRRIVNQLPTAAENSASGSRPCTFGAYACDEYFALWLARQPVYSESDDPARLFGLLAAYAWYSQAELSRRPMASSWCRGVQKYRSIQPYAPPKAGSTAYGSFFQLGPGAIIDSFGSSPGKPKTSRSCRCSSRRRSWPGRGPCRNCADQCGPAGAAQVPAVFGAPPGVRVATLEIDPHARETGVLAINQLKARHNMPASAEIWQAARTVSRNAEGFETACNTKPAAPAARQRGVAKPHSRIPGEPIRGSVAFRKGSIRIHLPLLMRTLRRSHGVRV